MDSVVPWFELEALIEPYYPKAGNGRQPVGLSIMLRIYFLQHWFNLSDPGAEDALYESPVLRGFAGVDLGRAAAPDESTILTFRHLLEQHDLCGKILDTVNWYLDSKGIRISTGTIVDATIITEAVKLASPAIQEGQYTRRPNRLRAALTWRENSISDRRLMRSLSSDRLRILASCPTTLRKAGA